MASFKLKWQREGGAIAVGFRLKIVLGVLGLVLLAMAVMGVWKGPALARMR
jgi:hypothetical protein